MTNIRTYFRWSVIIAAGWFAALELSAVIEFARKGVEINIPDEIVLPI